MNKPTDPRRRVRLAVRSSPAALKIALMALILFSIVALAALRWVHAGILEETGNLRQEAAELEHANEELLEKTEELGSVQSVMDIAQEELGLVDPNTVIIDPQS